EFFSGSSADLTAITNNTSARLSSLLSEYVAAGGAGVSPAEGTRAGETPAPPVARDSRHFLRRIADAYRLAAGTVFPASQLGRGRRTCQGADPGGQAGSVQDT